MAKRWEAHTSKNKKLPKKVNEDERYSHPWEDSLSILKRYGISLDISESGEDIDVGVIYNGTDAGEMNLSWDEERQVYQITYAELFGLPKGAGIGSSVYRAVRDYIGKKHQSTVASDFRRTADAERVWKGLVSAGLAKRKVMDINGVPAASNTGSELDYYVMEAYTSKLKEAREYSTAMVVVPGIAPGKNICKFIRDICADRSKLIVVAQPGDLDPGSFETLLRASMPDVEKKLRIMDSGDSLADAISSAERNRHYRPSQALDVFCNQEVASAFDQEIRHGSLKFDPTIISVHPQNVPSDDPNDIKSAIKSNDIDAMNRVLDPHVFSNQDSIANYSNELNEKFTGFEGQTFSNSLFGPQYSVPAIAKWMQQHSPLRSVRVDQIIDGPHNESDWEDRVEMADTIYPILLAHDENGLHVIDGYHRLEKLRRQGKKLIKARVIDMSELENTGSKINEDIQREFLSSIAPSRELAIRTLHNILGGELVQFGVDLDDLEYIGSGRNGSAYRTKDGMILKITTDPAEVKSAKKLVGLEPEHLGNIYEVSDLDENIWLIVQEDLDKLPEEFHEEFNMAMEIIDAVGAKESLRNGDARAVVAMLASCEVQSLAEMAVEVMRQFKVGGMCRELTDLGLCGDFHAGNIMLRDGEPVLTDLGTPGVDKGFANTRRRVNEFGTGAPGSGANGPPQMRGSNSSSWSSGRAALKAPQQNVPEDENATERDFALDQDIRPNQNKEIRGGGLDWGRKLGSSQ